MFATFATAIPTSTAITLALLYTMNLLIGVQPTAIVDAPERHPIAWRHVAPPDEPPRTIERMPDKSFVEPPSPPATHTAGDSDAGIGFHPPGTEPPRVPGYSGTPQLMTDGALISLVRPHPVYPAAASQRGLEGWVLVEFDVLENGTVANIRIVASSDDMFEKSARRAAAKFRFKPRVVDGIAVSTNNVRNLIRYEMAD